MKFAFMSLVAALVAGSAVAPIQAAARSDAAGDLHGCYAEAQWPVTASAAYVYGNARQREQLRNSSSPDVYRLQRVCFTMTRTGSAQQTALAADCGRMIADRLQTYGSKAHAHAVRQRALCEALSGQAVTVSGL